MKFPDWATPAIPVIKDRESHVKWELQGKDSSPLVRSKNKSNFHIIIAGLCTSLKKKNQKKSKKKKNQKIKRFDFATSEQIEPILAPLLILRRAHRIAVHNYTLGTRQVNYRCPENTDQGTTFQAPHT